MTSWAHAQRSPSPCLSTSHDLSDLSASSILCISDRKLPPEVKSKSLLQLAEAKLNPLVPKPFAGSIKNRSPSSPHHHLSRLPALVRPLDAAECLFNEEATSTGHSQTVVGACVQPAIPRDVIESSLYWLMQQHPLLRCKILPALDGKHHFVPVPSDELPKTPLPLLYMEGSSLACPVPDPFTWLMAHAVSPKSPLPPTALQWRCLVRISSTTSGTEAMFVMALSRSICDTVAAGSMMTKFLMACNTLLQGGRLQVADVPIPPSMASQMVCPTTSDMRSIDEHIRQMCRRIAAPTPPFPLASPAGAGLRSTSMSLITLTPAVSKALFEVLKRQSVALSTVVAAAAAHSLQEILSEHGAPLDADGKCFHWGMNVSCRNLMPFHHASAPAHQRTSQTDKYMTLYSRSPAAAIVAQQKAQALHPQQQRGVSGPSSGGGQQPHDVCGNYTTSLVLQSHFTPQFWTLVKQMTDELHSHLRNLPGAAKGAHQILAESSACTRSPQHHSGRSGLLFEVSGIPNALKVPHTGHLRCTALGMLTTLHEWGPLFHHKCYIMDQSVAVGTSFCPQIVDEALARRHTAKIMATLTDIVAADPQYGVRSG